MFLVMEIQKSTDSTLSSIVTQHDNLRDAKSKYHLILSYAAKSGLPRHSAAILHEDGHTMAYESFVTDTTTPEADEN